MKIVDSERLNIWQALSQLFLDTEVDQATFDHVARVIVESGYTTTQVHRILWHEVFPVLKDNLRSVAGEWTGWSDDWLIDHLAVMDGVVAKPARGWVAKEITRCWEEVLTRVESAHSPVAQ